MPTIDQLAPATAASDNDELLVSQSGIARKLTRAQVLAGVQPQLAISCGTLLGRISNGTRRAPGHGRHAARDFVSRRSPPGFMVAAGHDVVFAFERLNDAESG